MHPDMVAYSCVMVSAFVLGLLSPWPKNFAPFMLAAGLICLTAGMAFSYNVASPEHLVPWVRAIFIVLGGVSAYGGGWFIRMIYKRVSSR